MTFQTTVRNNIGFGVVGELFLEGPLRAQPAILASGAGAANNIVGRVFTVADDATGNFDTTADPLPLDVAAGGTGVFAGILANPKAYALVGASIGNPLSPSLLLADGTTVELVQETAGLIVAISTAAAVGDWVWFSQTTGALQTTVPGASAPAGTTRLPNGTVVRYETAAAGLAVIAFNG